MTSTSTDLQADPSRPNNGAAPQRGSTASQGAQPEPRLATDRVAILVLGMHRSGTSALTRVISLLGADLPSNLMPAVEDNNEAGFWESMDAYQLNDEILASAGSSWDDWRRFNPDWLRSPAKDAFRARAVALLEKDFGDSRLFVLKDPRICRLLPFWLEVLREFGAEPKCVLPLRNPLDVAASLKRRDGFGLAKALAVWLRHVLDAEYETRGLKRSFIAFDDLLDDWRGVMAPLSSALDLSWPRRSATAEVEIDRFLSHRHRHHRGDPAAVREHPEVAQWVKDAHAALNQLKASPEPGGARARLDAVRAEFDRACDVLGAVLRAEEVVHAEQTNALASRLEELETTVRQREARIHELEQVAAERDAALSEMYSVSDRLHQRIAELEQIGGERWERIGELEGMARERWERIGELEGMARERWERIGELEETARERWERIGELEEMARERWERIETLTHTVAERETENHRLRSELFGERQRLREVSGLRDRLLARLNASQTSGAGQLARPLYALDARWPGLTRGLAALPKAAWWTVTFRLPRHLRARRLAAELVETGLFDLPWYLEHNPDVVLQGLSPVVHWVAGGWSEGRDPNPRSDVRAFLAAGSGTAPPSLPALIEHLRRQVDAERSATVEGEQ